MTKYCSIRDEAISDNFPLVTRFKEMLNFVDPTRDKRGNKQKLDINQMGASFDQPGS